MGNELIRLKIVGITYNQIENGMYAMVLEEEGGELRLPIIIGYNEAQSIECLLQKITTPRPLTHEFAAKILESYSIEIESVLIKQLPNGIFSADVALVQEGERRVIDARSSDAIALAMRMGAPIYTTPELLKKSGIEKGSVVPNNVRIATNQSIPARQAVERVRRPSGMHQHAEVSIEQLEKEMQKAVENENYEKAEYIKKEIERRMGS